MCLFFVSHLSADVYVLAMRNNVRPFFYLELHICLGFGKPFAVVACLHSQLTAGMLVSACCGNESGLLIF